MNASMEIAIRIDINGEFGTWCAGMQVPDVFKMAYEPLKRCDDPALAMITGETYSEAAAQKVVKLREDAADRIAKQLARMIVESMGANDTLNGYPVRVE